MNRKHRTKIYGLVILVVVSILSSCKKDWLDAKPKSTLVVPTSISDFQALLNNQTLYFFGAELGEMGSDSYYVSNDLSSTIGTSDSLLYVWNKPLVLDGDADWDNPYQIIEIANLSLEGLDKISPDAASKQAWNNAEGTALFLRGFSFYSLAQIFCKPYSASSSTDLGVPLKLSSDINQKLGRGTVQGLYSQLLGDLKASLPLLPSQPASGDIFVPAKVSVYGLLARVYLAMSDYNNAKLYADSCLALNNKLLDFNTLNPTIPYPIPYPTGNPEDLFSYNLGLDYVLSFESKVDTTLYQSYSNSDLRKTIFFTPFDGGYQFQGSYYGNYGGINFPSGTLATDEIYITRAECLARANDLTGAANDLNAVLVNRYVKGQYVPFNFTDQHTAINTILTERKKELLFRGLRWPDLKRLNLDPQYAVTLKRVFNGQTYTLPPNDPRYEYPIPSEETNYNPIPQNPR